MSTGFSIEEARVAVRGVVERYFFALDLGRMELLGSCFAPDAVMTINGGEHTLTGRDGIVDAFRRLPFSTSTHLISSQQVDVDGVQAQAHTLALAFVVDAGGDGQVQTRGIEYRDTLVLVAQGWQIRRRDHSARWQYNARSVPPLLPSARD